MYVTHRHTSTARPAVDLRPRADRSHLAERLGAGQLPCGVRLYGHRCHRHGQPLAAHPVPEPHHGRHLRGLEEI
ncbi:MAG: hypothetical protein MZV64_00255 [Ignavibacteriales bacterium]|nr:hypothetical protein [Ignavibacteriales bacterium]